MDWLWLLLSSNLIIIGMVLLVIGHIDERRRKEPGIKLLWAIIFIVVGVLITFVYFNSFKDCEPPERHTGQETKYVLKTPPVKGRFLLTFL